MTHFQNNSLPNLNQPIYANTKLALQNYFDNIGNNANIALLGQAGLGKTAIVFKAITPQLFAESKIEKNVFLKVSIIKLLGEKFEENLKSQLNQGLGGVIFLDEIHHAKNNCEELLYMALQQFEHSKTVVILSTGGKFYNKLSLKYSFLQKTIPHTIYIRPYTENELATILISLFAEENYNQTLSQNEAYRIVYKLKSIRQSQNVQFEYMTDVLYYTKCFKKYIASINDTSINDKSISQALSMFYKPRFK